MLVEIFRQMAMRGAIDEQRKEWVQTPTVSANPSAGIDEEESDYGGSDSD